MLSALYGFNVNGSCIITLYSVFVQGIAVLNALFLYIYIMNYWLYGMAIYRNNNNVESLKT